MWVSINDFEIKKIVVKKKREEYRIDFLTENYYGQGITVWLSTDQATKLISELKNKINGDDETNQLEQEEEDLIADKQIAFIKEQTNGATDQHTVSDKV